MLCGGRDEKEHERGGVYIRQIICMFMVHFLGFAAICLETEDVSYIIFYGFQQILLFATIALFRVAYPEADKLVINNMCMLLTISFIMLTRISYQKSIRQFIIVAVSLIIGLFIPFLVSKLKFLKHLTWIYGMVGVFALLVVAVLGSVTHGSKISYSINGFTFQPSEFVKILFVFFIAGLLTESKSLGQVVISAVAAAAHVIILVFSKDLGSAVIFLQATSLWYLLQQRIILPVCGDIRRRRGIDRCLPYVFARQNKSDCLSASMEQYQ